MADNTELKMLSTQNEQDTYFKSLLLKKFAELPADRFALVPTEPVGVAYGPTKKKPYFRLSMGLTDELFNGKLEKLTDDNNQFFMIVIDRLTLKGLMRDTKKETDAHFKESP